MQDWKVEEHEMPKYNYLAGKIDKLVEDPVNSTKMTTQEIIEFLQIWERRQFNDTKDTAFINYVKQCINQGDTDILFK